MKACTRAVLVLMACAVLSAPAAAGDLKLEIRNGLVNLDARDVPVRDILAEWARIGHTRIENREQVGGAPVTLTLKDVPERDALEILLRSVSGYIAAPRPAPIPDQSIFDVVYVLAAARPAQAYGSAGSTQGQSQQLIRGVRGQMPATGIGIRPNQPADDPADDVSPPVMRPGFTVEQLQQYQAAPGTIMMVPPTQTNQAPPMPYSLLPGAATQAGATVPAGATSAPGLVAPATPPTQAKPIKPPGGPVSTP